MMIVIDARMYQESGVGRYIRNLIKYLENLDEKNEYFILHLKSEYDSLVLDSATRSGTIASSAYHTKNFHKVLADFKWYGFSEQQRLPYILNKLSPDLVHFPHFNVPIFYRGKFVVTIHDLIHQHFQMRRATTLDPFTYKIKQLGYNFVFKNAIKNSIKILVPSNYVKDLLVKNWKVPEDKILVTYEAVEDNIFSIAKLMTKGKINKIMQKFKIKSPYLFYVGNAHPHKNVEGLIKAYLSLQKRYHGLKLVLAGHDQYFWQRIKTEYQHKDIIHSGFISDEELVALYKNALCFVMPSFEEGFGIPLLEAMACGCPVVSSNAASLPEVGGNAAIYFDAHDPTDIEHKIDMVLKSEKIRANLIEKGQKRYKQFSWEKLAKQTLEVYERCV